MFVWWLPEQDLATIGNLEDFRAKTFERIALAELDVNSSGGRSRQISVCSGLA